MSRILRRKESPITAPGADEDHNHRLNVSHALRRGGCCGKKGSENAKREVLRRCSQVGLQRFLLDLAGTPGDSGDQKSGHWLRKV